MNLLTHNKKVRTIWIIRNLILSIIMLVPIVIACFSEMLGVILGVSIPCAIIIILLMIWPFLKYKMYSFGYDDKRIAINFGVIFRHKVIIPIRQIQDLHTYNGPIMSLMGLSGVIISTAGSNFAIAGMLNADGTNMVNDLEALLNKRLDGEYNEEI